MLSWSVHCLVPHIPYIYMLCIPLSFSATPLDFLFDWAILNKKSQVVSVTDTYNTWAVEVWEEERTYGLR